MNNQYNNGKQNEPIIYAAVIGAVIVAFVMFTVMMFSTSDSDGQASNEVRVDTATDAEQLTDAAPPADTPTVPSDTPHTQTAAPPAVTAPTAAVTPTVTSPTAPSPAVTSSVASKPTSSSPSGWDPLLAETADAGQEYLDKLIFLGDSTTYGLRYYEKLNGGKSTAQVWTPKSGTLALFNISTATVVYPETNEEITIKEALTRSQPEYLVITLGVNGIATLKEKEFKLYYNWLIDAVRSVSPDTKIICQTMFPVASNYANLKTINNEKIAAGNEWILEVASEKNVKFIDTYSLLVGADGWLPADLQNGDGLHLNSKGFDIELQNLRTHAYLD